MQTDDLNNEIINEENIELRERIESIKNIGYLIYTGSNSIAIKCFGIGSCVMALIAYFGMGRDRVALIFGLTLIAISAVIISIILAYIFIGKQYLVENKDGKKILIVGGIRRFRKYYVNRTCYVIKCGQAQRTKAKKTNSIKKLFSGMKKSRIVKKTSESKETFSIEQKNDEGFLDAALGGGCPVKYGTMTFVKGKFKKGSYIYSAKMHSALYFRVVKNDVKCEDIVPQSILNALEKKTRNRED